MINDGGLDAQSNMRSNLSILTTKGTCLVNDSMNRLCKLLIRRVRARVGAKEALSVFQFPVTNVAKRFFTDNIVVYRIDLIIR